MRTFHSFLSRASQKQKRPAQGWALSHEKLDAVSNPCYFDAVSNPYYLDALLT